MDNQQSSTNSGSQLSSQGYGLGISIGILVFALTNLNVSSDGSRTTVNRNNNRDYSGNTGSYNIIGSGNIINNNCCHDGGKDLCNTHDQILQCLYTSRYEEHRDRVRAPVEGTCTWVTEHSKYKDWLEGGVSGVLWLSADPGCGKSVIASYLVKHLESRPDAIVCYFFFKDDSEEQRSATFALCAVLHQIFKRRPHLIEFAREEFKAKGKGFTE